MLSGGREWRNQDGAGKEQSKDVVSAGVSFSLIPWWLSSRNCTIELYPRSTWCKGLVFCPPISVVGQSLGVRAATPPWQLPFSLAQFSIERGNWEILATTPPAAGGWVCRPEKGVWGGTPTGFTADLTLLLSPVPSSGEWVVKLKGTRRTLNSPSHSPADLQDFGLSQMMSG